MEPVIDGGWRALQAHPPSRARLEALRTWEASEDYAAILDGRYARRGDEKKQAGRWLEARAATLREGWASAMTAFEERSQGS